MKLLNFSFLLAFAFCCYCCTSTNSDSELPEDVTEILPDSARKLFATCAVCHMDNGQSRAPGLIHLGAMTPRSIVASLESGKMQEQGKVLTKVQKIALAEMLTNRKYLVNDHQSLNFCSSDGKDLATVSYQGWGGNERGTGNIPDEVAQLSLAEVPGLKLKWAFGFEGGTVTRTKPAVLGDYIIFGSQFGAVYCLDMQSGCVRWVFEADANVRGGIALSHGDEGPVAYFADFGVNAYALDAASGNLIWKSSLKTEPYNAVTGTVAYHDGMIYVPLTSMEVVSAGQNSYECCKGSGQVVAIDAGTGAEIWRHRVIREPATERGMNKSGSKTFGPSGAPVWCSPTVDASRGLLYIGTGENNSIPTTDNSDAIQALDLKTGNLIWNYQATPKDAYISACPDAANCPDPPGPDVDFGMAPILTSRSDGKEVLVVGQKSGVVHCLDPDSGKPLWKKRIGRGGALGGIHWGMATDGKLVYASNSDWLDFGSDENYPASPGLYALDIMTGEVVWSVTSDPEICRDKPGCYNSNSAAPTLIQGIVFAGSLDGHARAYRAQTGEIIWDYDTNRSFKTVNGVEAHGGSIDGPGPVVANGMVFFNSGYGLFSQLPGNVLLAFAAN